MDQNDFYGGDLSPPKKIGYLLISRNFYPSAHKERLKWKIGDQAGSLGVDFMTPKHNGYALMSRNSWTSVNNGMLKMEKWGIS